LSTASPPFFETRLHASLSTLLRLSCPTISGCRCPDFLSSPFASRTECAKSVAAASSSFLSFRVKVVGLVSRRSSPLPAPFSKIGVALFPFLPPSSERNRWRDRCQSFFFLSFSSLRVRVGQTPSILQPVGRKPCPSASSPFSPSPSSPGTDVSVPRV